MMKDDRIGLPHLARLVFMDSSSSNTMKYCSIMLEGPISNDFQLINPGSIKVLSSLSLQLNLPIIRNTLLQRQGYRMVIS